MDYTALLIRCPRCSHRYLGTICNLCKLGRDGVDYK